MERGKTALGFHYLVFRSKCFYLYTETKWGRQYFSHVSIFLYKRSHYLTSWEQNYEFRIQEEFQRVFRVSAPTGSGGWLTCSSNSTISLQFTSASDNASLASWAALLSPYIYIYIKEHFKIPSTFLSHI